MIDLTLLDEQIEEGKKDDRELPDYIRQEILETYIVPGNVVQSGKKPYMIFKVLPRTKKYKKRVILEDLSYKKYAWDEYPISRADNLYPYSAFPINAVYAPDYDEKYANALGIINHERLIQDIKDGNGQEVWRKDDG